MTEQFKIALRSLKRQYPTLLEIIGAQWALESNYGKSPLAREAANYSGLGYRDLSAHLPKDVWERVGKCEYTGQDGDTKDYLLLYKPADFPEVYMAFLSRPHYKIVETDPSVRIYSPKFFDELPFHFMAHIASKGFCYWVKNVKRKDFETEEEYLRATFRQYLADVMICANSKKFRALLEEL